MWGNLKQKKEKNVSKIYGILHDVCSKACQMSMKVIKINTILLM